MQIDNDTHLQQSSIINQSLFICFVHVLVYETNGWMAIDVQSQHGGLLSKIKVSLKTKLMWLDGPFNLGSGSDINMISPLWMFVRSKTPNGLKGSRSSAFNHHLQCSYQGNNTIKLHKTKNTHQNMIQASLVDLNMWLMVVDKNP